MSAPIGNAGKARAGRSPASGLTREQVWRELAKSSFAVLDHVTPTGRPRSSGVLYSMIDRRMYVVVAADSWKARHLAANEHVAVTVPVRRGGILSLLMPIPPATISFHGTATVHAADSPLGQRVLSKMARLLPPERQATSRIVEIRPEDWFVTYGLGVSLPKMRDPELARARVPTT